MDRCSYSRKDPKSRQRRDLSRYLEKRVGALLTQCAGYAILVSGSRRCAEALVWCREVGRRF